MKYTNFTYLTNTQESLSMIAALWNRVRKIEIKDRYIVCFFLLFCCLTYGVLIPKLGLYWDDFPYTWLGHVLGPSVYYGIFFQERPILGVLYSITAPIFNESILGWQLFAIFTRWLTVLPVFWLMRLVWPENRKEAWWVSLLFLVYPGFSQQWISTLFGRAFLLLVAFLFSLCFMVKGIQDRKHLIWYDLAAFACIIIAHFSSEYYVGLEIIRPLLIFFLPSILMEPLKNRIKQTFLYWLPYLIAILAFGIWRAFFVSETLYGVDLGGQVHNGLGAVLLNLIESMARNAFLGGVYVWIRPFILTFLPEMMRSVLVIYILVVLLIFFLAIFIVNRIKSGAEKPVTKSIDRWGWEAIAIGVISLLTASFPSWAGGLPFSLDYPYDRFSLAMMLSAGLMVTGLFSFIKFPRIRTIGLALIVAFAAGWQVRNADAYRIDWVKLNDLLHQITWRMPDIKPNTILATQNFPLTYYSDNSLTAPINWTYAPDIQGTRIPYLVSYLEVRKNSVFSNFLPNQPAHYPLRKLDFYGNTSDTVVVYKPVLGCLTVLDDKYNNWLSFPYLPDQLQQAIPLSNPDRIIANAARVIKPIPQYFEDRDENTWCYYYEKAELARQTGDWLNVVALWDKSQKGQMVPNQATEYYPFVEGLGMSGKMDQAISLSRKVISIQPGDHNGICQIWGRIEAVNPAIQDVYTRLQKEFRCNQ
jgi:hypothetical protein